MLEAYFRISFILFMGMSLGIILGFLPLLIIQSFIFKKILDPAYLNTNHFSLYEVSIFDSLPLSLIKTLAYIRAIVFPSTMKKRFQKKILIAKEKPVIYSLAIITLSILFISSIIIFNTLIMGAIIFFS